jgi:hypothetical protein
VLLILIYRVFIQSDFDAQVRAIAALLTGNNNNFNKVLTSFSFPAKISPPSFNQAGGQVISSLNHSLLLWFSSVSFLLESTGQSAIFLVVRCGSQKSDCH